MTADTQIKSFFQRWERLEGEKKAISDDLKELFSEAKHAGYDSKALRAAFNRKVKQDAETTADQQFDMVVDTYLDAINGVARDARIRARENIEKFDPQTGEILEDINPRLAKQVVDGMQTEAGRAALIAAVDILIEQEEAEEENSPETATTQRVNGHSQHEGANAQATVRNEVVTVVGTESGTVSNGSRPADPAGSGGDPGIPSSDDSGVKMELSSNSAPGRRDVKSLHSNAESERATNTNSEIDPSEDRKEGHSLDGNVGANAGGDHVNRSVERASGRQQDTHTLNNRLDGVPVQSVKKPLRPLCRNPGDNCGGYGSTHCASCLRASKQAEVAA